MLEKRSGQQEEGRDGNIERGVKRSIIHSTLDYPG
jgi:hypothetical protein